MNFSGKMCFKIMLKVTRNQGFTLSLEDTFFEKPQVPSPYYFRVKEDFISLDSSNNNLKLHYFIR